MLREREPDFSIRYAAAHALRAIGPGAKEAVPALLKSLNDRVGFMRAAAAIALLKIAPESESKITPSLLKEAKAWIERVERTGRSYELGFGVAPPPKSAEAAKHLWSGHKYYEQKDLDAAIGSYTKAVEFDPQYAEAYYSRGRAHRATGNYAAAIADFTQTINLNAYNADAHYGRGHAYEMKGNKDAAIADYDRAVEIFPPVIYAFRARGRVKLAQGKIDAAIADFDKAIQLNPQFADAYNLRGTAYSETGDLARAIADYSEAIRLKPDFIRAYNNRAIMYKRIGDKAKAQAYRDKAAELEKQGGSRN
jgi:tetratricopeptide (TPR) repeat protein